MTEEELEQKFNAWKSEQYKDQSTEEKLEFVEHLHTFPKYFKQAYIAGATENGLQWHDLRKNSEDLPKNGSDVIIAFYAIDYGTRKPSKEIVSDYCIYFNKLWTDRADGEPYPYLNQKGVVIAWCEIPTYKDKE